MATFTKRNQKWRAQVRKKGVSKSAEFSTKAEAQRWALAIESQIDAGEYSGIPKITFAELIDKYIREVTMLKGGARPEKIRLQRIADTFLGAIQLEDLTKADFARWQAERLQQVQPNSVLRERTSLSAVINQAIRWDYLKNNPLKNLEQPKAPPARTRRLSQDEIDALLYAASFSFDSPPETRTSRVGSAMLFAIETAMRAGEICGLTWEHINFNNNTAYLPKTKNGHPRTVPLSSQAVKILRHLEQVKSESDPTAFQLTTASLDAIFRKLKARVGIEDLHFHDTRREAATRLSKVLTVMELAKVTGHRDLSILQNTYYAPDMSEIAGKLG